MRSAGNRSINGPTAKQYTTRPSGNRGNSAPPAGTRAVSAPNSDQRGERNATASRYAGRNSRGGDDRYGGYRTDGGNHRYDGRSYSHSGRGGDYRHDGHYTSYRPDYHRSYYYPQRHYYYGRPAYYYSPRVIHRPVTYYRPIYVSGAPYYYYGGYFYRPYYDNFWISVTAPIGAHVGVLPAGYVSFGYGGHSYFYVNATYYLYDQPSRQYVVVEPPPGGVPGDAGGASPSYEGTSEDIFVYPAQGQSAEQTDRDRYECHVWAVSQTGVDPSTGDTDERERADYRRALTACLDGRGYTVR